MKGIVLVVGNNVRNVVQSAFKAGYKVYALTKFVDSDLTLFSEKVYPIEDDSPSWVKKKAEDLSEGLNAKIVLASGYEDLEVKGEILGSDPKAIKNVLNKLRFYKTLERAGLPFPEILEKKEGKCILKPIRGGGGEEIKVLGNSNSKGRKEGYLIQRLIEGIPCSASLMVGKEIEVIALNEILAGWNEMNAQGFRYAGNITPFLVEEEVRKRLISLAEEVCRLFDLRGSVGVDFIIEKSSMKPYILEINPRFQGSLDSIEWSTDLNLFNLHMRALEGKSVRDEIKMEFRRVAIRTIYFSDKTMEIKKDVTGNPFYADIPMKGSIYDKDDPVVSILSSGKTRKEVIEKVIGRRNLFLKLIWR